MKQSQSVSGGNRLVSIAHRWENDRCKKSDGDFLSGEDGTNAQRVVINLFGCISGLLMILLPIFDQRSRLEATNVFLVLRNSLGSTKLAECSIVHSYTFRGPRPR